MLLGFNGAAVWIVVAHLSLFWLAPLLLAGMVFATAVERIIPYQPAWNDERGDFGRDLAHAVVNVAIILFLVLVLRPGRVFWPQALPIWVQLLFAILVLDAGVSIAHYLSHRFDWLWRFHAAHHSMTRMYGFNGLLQHPLHQAFEIILGGGLLIAIGMPHEVGLLLGFAVVIQLLLQHSNADMRIGPFAWLLAVAPVHRRHHRRTFKAPGVNFGLFVNIWDHLLGVADVGESAAVGPDDLGIEDPDYPKPYLAQVREPWVRERPDAEGEASEVAH
jgi:sterol desaturase/sphingolipid hydroxylase (fatty acid hydroxylase superfamily)